MERENRRGELALYVLPRGADTLFRVMKQRGWPVALVPGGLGEAMLFCLGMGGLSYFYHFERDTCAPLFVAAYGSLVETEKGVVDVGVACGPELAGGPTVTPAEELPPSRGDEVNVPQSPQFIL